MAKPLPKPQVDKGRVWVVFIGGAAALFGTTLLLENNPSFFPSISKANKASRDAIAAAEERERQRKMEETTVRDVERQTAMVEEGLAEARARALGQPKSDAESAQPEGPAPAPSSSSEPATAATAAAVASAEPAKAEGHANSSKDTDETAKRERLESFVSGMKDGGKSPLGAAQTSSKD